MSSLKLDEVDHRIFEELQRNGRATMEELAQVVGLSRVAVRARVNRLITSGALRVTGIVHPAVTGIQVYAHLSISVSSSASPVAEALARMEHIPLVSVVAGRAALIAEVHAVDRLSLREIVDAVAEIEHVTHVETAIYTERVKDLYAPPGIIPPSHLSDVDRQILELLKVDGRTSFAELARCTQYSASAVRARVQHLLEAGVVRISTIIAPGMIGLQHMCGFGVRIRGGHDVVAHLVEMDSVSYLSLTMSRFDAIGTLLAANQAELVRELNRIRALSGVESLECWTHLEVVKENDTLTAFDSLERL